MPFLNSCNNFSYIFSIYQSFPQIIATNCDKQKKAGANVTCAGPLFARHTLATHDGRFL